MNRLYVVENRFTLTGAMADHRLRCPASQIAGVRACARRERSPGATKMPDLVRSSPRLTPPAGAMPFDDRWLTRSGERSDLEIRREPGAGGAASAGRGAIARLRDQRRAEEHRARRLIVREFPRNPRTNSISAARGGNERGPDQAAFHFWRRSGLQRTARSGVGPRDETAARLG